MASAPTARRFKFPTIVSLCCDRKFFSLGAISEIRMHKMPWRSGLLPGPPWGAYNAHQDLAGFGEGTRKGKKEREREKRGGEGNRSHADVVSPVHVGTCRGCCRCRSPGVAGGAGPCLCAL